MRIHTKLSFIIILLLVVSCQNDDVDYIVLESELGEELTGGETTIFDVSENAFGFQAPNLDRENSLFFFTGNSLFFQNWVSAPASTTARDGLGPLFNARSCSTCHFKDGRGRAPELEGEIDHGLLLRLSIPGTSANGENKPDPIYGGQLQDQSILNASTEGGFTITYENQIVKYKDGTSVTLRKPIYTIQNLAFGQLAPDIQVSPRVAQQIIGLGLLEGVPEATLLEIADEFDLNNDGISGKPNYVWDIESQSLKIGRFGWKANQPTIKQQVAGAFAGDLGITSSLFPEENCTTGVDCTSFPNGGEPELSDENLDKVTLYSSTLAVPARRNHKGQKELKGKELFSTLDCVACHIPKLKSGPHQITALTNQTFTPYTDLLLHDMGEGLADFRPDFKATGKEWRTPPLWGIGLLKTVNNHTNLLHDGRARNVEEAILWHDGEAKEAKSKFMSLHATEREQVIAFIKSL